jgi:hypothetical protein
VVALGLVAVVFLPQRELRTTSGLQAMADQRADDAANRSASEGTSA